MNNMKNVERKFNGLQKITKNFFENSKVCQLVSEYVDIYETETQFYGKNVKSWEYTVNFDTNLHDSCCIDISIRKYENHVEMHCNLEYDDKAYYFDNFVELYDTLTEYEDECNFFKEVEESWC